MGKMTQRELKDFVVTGRRGRSVVLVPLEVASRWAARGRPDDEFRGEGRGGPTLSPSFPPPPAVGARGRGGGGVFKGKGGNQGAGKIKKRPPATIQAARSFGRAGGGKIGE